MKNTLTCHSCNHKWEHDSIGSYPCGPCPTSCPKCGEYCCPDCGGEMGKSIDDGNDMDMYTSGSCNSCNYTCCGGCI